MNNRLLNIGREIASIWGASCYDFEVDKDESQVVFYCREHGEEFVTTLSFDELLKDYNYKVQ